MLQQPRYYEKEGRKYLSVTTALSIIRKPPLEQWRGNLGNVEADRIAEEAGDIGRRVHDTIKLINQGRNPNKIIVSDDIQPMVERYIAWHDKYVEGVIAVEQTVYNELYQYAGTYDLLAVLRGDKLPTLIDIKTGRSIAYPEIPLQLAGYQKTLPDGIKIKQRAILHLPREGNKLVVKTYPQKEYDYHFRLFLYALELYRYVNSDS